MLLIGVFVCAESVELEVAGLAINLTWHIWILLAGEICTEELARWRVLSRRIVDVGSTSFCEGFGRR